MQHRGGQIAGNNAERSRVHNRRVVLGYLQNAPQAGRAEIARASGLSTQTVSNLVAELEREGLVIRTGRRRTERGQPPVQYSFNPAGGAALGFEVRPDVLIMALSDLGGTLLMTRQVTLTDSDPATVFAAMRPLAQAARRAAPGPVMGAGLVVPGPFGVEGLSAAGETVLHGWDGITAADQASAALDMPVLLQKDATAAAIAEGMRGAAQGLDGFCVLYFGKGLGLGVVAQGQPLRGSSGNAGEIGHVIVTPGGTLCACGNRGCLEQYVSRMALRRFLVAQGMIVPDPASEGPGAGPPSASGLLPLAAATGEGSTGGAPPSERPAGTAQTPQGARAENRLGGGDLPDDAPPDDILADDSMAEDQTDAVALALLAAHDPRLLAWLDAGAAALSRAIGMLENLLDPDTVILAGALPDAILDALIARLVLPPGSVARRAARKAPRVQRGTSGVLTAALAGAALIIHDVVTPRLDSAL
ncbi:ROK family transcriptional regulator [Roseicitreum antarcticum]|uniref:Winged helix-turn-helix DNA-binding n=1 Tax=Roseicitreum antarcticum TaxID=564137 RepID=A0A1H2XQH3_9RHOB|nr:ROK family transcriptional regulator [Roseicitreum antarcticum]SDW95103.1 Winged helix-turn-helix DNA-binding [Roseicitreum antarcticum]